MTRFSDLRCAHPLHFIDPHDRVHRYEAAHYAIELRLELLFAGVDHDGGALAEDEFFHFQKTPQITLIDLFGVHLEHLSLVEKNHLVDWSFAFGHNRQTVISVLKKGANYSMPLVRRR